MEKVLAFLKGLIPKINLSKPEGKLKLLILVLVLVLFGGAGAVNYQKVNMKPEFCLSCHEMRPEGMTWQATSHARINCVECHVDQTAKMLSVAKMTAASELMFHFTGNFERPIRKTERMEDSICLQCHSVANRFFTVSGDLIIPHSKHGNAGVKCVNCHSGVVHGDIAERGTTATGELAAWTPAMGVKNTSAKYVKPKMNTCMQCHTDRKVTTKCEACHTTVFIPDNHKKASWTKDHGPMAEKNLSYCNDCHSFSLQGKYGKDITAKEYARGNVYCYTCHTKLPVGHTEDWKIIHKRQAIPNKAGCLICHDEKQPAAGSKATKTYCDFCHRRAQTPATVTPGQKVDQSLVGTDLQGKIEYKKEVDTSKSHPAGWIKQHPQVVKDIGTSGGKCYDCHDRNNCFKCHTGGGKT
ncbi:MAG TPA: NapC/NirT family cytochrome c [Bacillota bacterium]|nr:NapC/NirT family cytochrome c [Bacillota bacterium]